MHIALFGINKNVYQYIKMDACIENNLQAVIVAVVLGAMSIIGNCVMGYKLMCGSGEHRTVAQRLEMVNLKNIKKSKLKSKDIEEYVMEIGEDNDRHIVRSNLPEWVVEEYNSRNV